MHDTVINDIYDRISKILKNDQKFPYDKIGNLIVEYVQNTDNCAYYFQNYPPLLDVMELSGNLEHGETNYQKEIIEQIRYKMHQLLKLLPEIK